MALLVQNLDRLDEQIKEEADGVHNSLGISSFVIVLSGIAIIDKECHRWARR